jgi:acetyl-CoA carboxylase carboxyltransferase component
MAGDEKDAIEYVKALLSYLPSNNLSEPPAFPEEADLETSETDRELDTIVPDSANQPYDMHAVIEHVLDDGEFLETQSLFAPNIVTGFGRVEGASVGVVANQPMQFAGCLDIDASEKAARFVRTCDTYNIPVLTFVDVPGFLPGTDQEWNGIIRRGAKLIYAYAEATVPLITVITRKAYGGAYDVMGSKHLGADLNLAWPTAQIAVMGAQGAVNILYRRELAAAGGPVYSPALTDFVVMVDGTSQMFITGPDVVKAVTGEDVTLEDLGGARTHNTRSGNAHYLAADEHDALDYVRELIGYLPPNNMTAPDILPADSEMSPPAADLELDTVIPDSANQPYDMTRVIDAILDDGEFLQVHELFAPNIVVGFGRIDGRSVGIVANQPMHLAGTLDIDASEKAARFVRTCDAFNIPVVTFVDVPGFLPGTDQEWNGIIRRGAKLIYAYAEATVPLVTVITRKAYGGAYDVMGSKHLGADINLAWPTAQIAVVGAQGAVNILYRKELRAAATAGEDVEALRTRLQTDYEDQLANPYIAADRGYVDQVIKPSRTRVAITKALRVLADKRETLPPRKHGNIPL